MLNSQLHVVSIAVQVCLLIKAAHGKQRKNKTRFLRHSYMFRTCAEILMTPTPISYT